MADSFDLTKLEPSSFEHLVNQLALKVLGAGATGFGPGPDAGRDGYFHGEADYPSKAHRWRGEWYIQSKFHKPHLTTNSQNWLLGQIKNELKLFKDSSNGRKVPDIWIIATNIEPSGRANTGAYDKAKNLVKKEFPELSRRFDIWGGKKILDLLMLHPEISDYYKHFLTPGHVLTELFEQIGDSKAKIKDILNYLIIKQFGDQQFTKLEQAGSNADNRPGIHKLFIDLPYFSSEFKSKDLVIKTLLKTSLNTHKIDSKRAVTIDLIKWNRFPSRARTWFIKGGPGQGKSTIGQYFSQIQRASFILESEELDVLPQHRLLAEEIKKSAESKNFWTSNPRIPVIIELKDYAHWFNQKADSESRGILTYLAGKITAGVEQTVQVGTLKRALSCKSWFFAFDGLDEVPHDVKDKVAEEIKYFIDNVALDAKADFLSICTSRPQGYSGQFNDIDGPTINLSNLNPTQALECAAPILYLDRNEEEANKSFEILESAIQSSSVAELMTTPLQSHIMAVVIRDGGKPPERRWQLFDRFYDVIKRREANRNLPDPKIARLLREEEQLLRTVHNRLGFVLHARAETSEGATTNLDKAEFETLLLQTVAQMNDNNVSQIVETLMEATTERLVLVNTPDDGNHVRFDVRQLQEFFASEFLYDSVDADDLRVRIETIAGDSHWEEVMHFMLSALVENNRKTELSVAVEVLNQLDDEDNDYKNRFLNKRLAKGALLASRLLQEGVLEQDKRVRNLFRKTLEPLMALTDITTLRYFITTTQNNSLSWLIDILFESLKTASYAENIGAALTLTFLLPDNHEKTLEVKDFLLNSPYDYIESIILKRNAEYVQVYKPKKTKWLAEVILNFILKYDISLISNEVFSACKNFFQADDSQLEEFIENFSCTDLEKTTLKLLLGKSIFQKTPPKTISWQDFGFIRGMLFEDDWTKRKDIEKFRSYYYESELSSSSIIQFTQSLLKFIFDPKVKNLKLVLGYIELNPNILKCIPPILSAYLPISIYLDLNRQIEYLRSLSENEFSLLLENNKFAPYPLYPPIKGLELTDESTRDQWKSLIDFAPQIAVDLINQDTWKFHDISKNSYPEILNEPDSINILINKLIDNPEPLYNKPEVWGKIFKQKTENSEILRNQLADIKLDYFEPNFMFIEKNKSHFEIKLPEEINLLPQLAKLVQCDTIFAESLAEVEEINQFLLSLIPSEDILQKVIDMKELDLRSRSCALLLLIFSTSNDKIIENNSENILSLFSDIKYPWFFVIFSSIFNKISDPKKKFIKLALGQIMEAHRDNIKISEAFESILIKLRGESHSCITISNVQESWLAI